MADVGLPLNVIGAQLRRGIDLVVHISRTAEGGRKVTKSRRSASDRRPPAFLAGIAAVLAVVAVGEALGTRTPVDEGQGPGRGDRTGGKRAAAGPGSGAWLAATVEPLRRARREGYLPTSDERFRLALLFSFAAITGGWWLAGPVVGSAWRLRRRCWPAG